jgi:hypothetical protein
MLRWVRSAGTHLVFRFPETRMVLSSSSTNMMSNTSSWVSILVSASVLTAEGLTTTSHQVLFPLYYLLIFQLFADLLQLLFKLSCDLHHSTYPHKYHGVVIHATLGHPNTNVRDLLIRVMESSEESNASIPIL